MRQSPAPVRVSGISPAFVNDVATPPPVERLASASLRGKYLTREVGRSRGGRVAAPAAASCPIVDKCIGGEGGGGRSRQSKGAEVLRKTVENLVTRAGDRACEVTTTCAEFMDDEGRLESMVRSTRQLWKLLGFTGEYVWVKERQVERGRRAGRPGPWHVHWVLVAPESPGSWGRCRDGVERARRSAWARNMWRVLSRRLPGYGWGPVVSVNPIKSAGAMGGYLGKYLGKGLAERGSEGRGVRLWGATAGLAAGTERFAWNNAWGWVHRQRCREYCRLHGVESEDGAVARWGARWVWVKRDEIDKTPLPPWTVYPSGIHARVAAGESPIPIGRGRDGEFGLTGVFSDGWRAREMCGLLSDDDFRKAEAMRGGIRYFLRRPGLGGCSPPSLSVALSVQGELAV